MIFFSLPRYQYLSETLGQILAVGHAPFTAKRFPNQELHISLSVPVAGRHCVVLGSTIPPDEDLLTLLLLSHTIKKEKALDVTVIIPYMGYARQDKNEPGKSLAALWLADILAASGVRHVITLDMHSVLAKQFSPLYLESLSAETIFVNGLAQEGIDRSVTFIAPDEGAVERCVSLARVLGGSPNVVSVSKKHTDAGVVSSELQGTVGARAVIVDDILDTGQTLVNCAKKLKDAGVKDILVVVTHGLFTGTIWQELWNLGVRRIYCTDSVPRAKEYASEKVVVLPIANVLADAIKQTGI